MHTVKIANFQPREYSVNLVVDTNVYASGDLLSDRVAIPLVAQVPSEGYVCGRIVQVTLTDRDDEQALLDLVFLDADVSLGTINSAPTITDDNTAAVLAVVPVTSYTDLGGADTARPSFDPIYFESDGSGQIYVAAISRGTPTYAAASDLRLKLMIELANVNR